jgi:hypothetical protein
MRWAGHVERKRERKGAYRVLVVSSDGKISPGRSRGRWDYNINMDIHEVGWGGMDWLDLAQDRERCRAVVNAVLNRRVL